MIKSFKKVLLMAGIIFLRVLTGPLLRDKTSWRVVWSMIESFSKVDSSSSSLRFKSNCCCLTGIPGKEKEKLDKIAVHKAKKIKNKMR